MVKTLGRCDTPKERIEILLCVRQMFFPEQSIDWEYLLDEFVVRSDLCFQSTFTNRMRFLVMCGMSERVEALPFKVWRDHITNMIRTAVFEWMWDNLGILRSIQSKLAHFEDELPKLKEATTMLELALWKVRMTVKSHQDMVIQSQKKMKTDASSIRQQCRVICGADVVIGHVLPFLIMSKV